MRVNNSTPLNGPEIPQGRVSQPSVSPSDAGGTEDKGDEVALSAAGASALSNHAGKVEELKALVNSSSYMPAALDVSKKLVSDALSRPS